MGRERIEIAYIKDSRVRAERYKKRKFGLVKKAVELSILTGCEVALVIFGPDGKLTQYSSGVGERAAGQDKSHSPEFKGDIHELLNKFVDAREADEEYNNESYENYFKRRGEDDDPPTPPPKPSAIKRVKTEPIVRSSPPAVVPAATKPPVQQQPKPIQPPQRVPSMGLGGSGSPAFGNFGMGGGFGIDSVSSVMRTPSDIIKGTEEDKEVARGVKRPNELDLDGLNEPPTRLYRATSSSFGLPYDPNMSASPNGLGFSFASRQSSQELSGIPPESPSAFFNTNPSSPANGITSDAVDEAFQKSEKKKK
uniref:MADS-box domain-containing protein n=2 Tax=Palpitomonas bilix TaxID=652834 RepID=A0A7S3DG05_9EUKA|mmetsp:Transcript_36044/g.93769  ORF Transcript_36044/g.93769 Transcript_36044/m.93769 type:complete len:309 (+) Transcript_36044:342-1268(+)